MHCFCLSKNILTGKTVVNITVKILVEFFKFVSWSLHFFAYSFDELK